MQPDDELMQIIAILAAELGKEKVTPHSASSILTKVVSEALIFKYTTNYNDKLFYFHYGYAIQQYFSTIK